MQNLGCVFNIKRVECSCKVNYSFANVAAVVADSVEKLGRLVLEFENERKKTGVK